VCFAAGTDSPSRRVRYGKSRPIRCRSDDQKGVATINVSFYDQLEFDFEQDIAPVATLISLATERA
jgi:hypothetical protein